MTNTENPKVRSQDVLRAKPGVAAQPCKPSLEGEGRRLGVQGHPGLHSGFQTSLGHLRIYLQNPKAVSSPRNATWVNPNGSVSGQVSLHRRVLSRESRDGQDTTVQGFV